MVAGQTCKHGQNWPQRTSQVSSFLAKNTVSAVVRDSCAGKASRCPSMTRASNIPSKNGFLGLRDTENMCVFRASTKIVLSRISTVILASLCIADENVNCCLTKIIPSGYPEAFDTPSVKRAAFRRNRHGQGKFQDRFCCVFMEVFDSPVYELLNWRIVENAGIPVRLPWIFPEPSAYSLSAAPNYDNPRPTLYWHPDSKSLDRRPVHGYAKLVRSRQLPCVITMTVSSKYPRKG